jgi:hypothetical protein
MPKTQQCDRCLYNARDSHLVCTVHPTGVEGEHCPDFRPDPNLEAKEHKNGFVLSCLPVSYYNGQLVVQPRQRWTQEEQLQLLVVHPLFTGRCPECEATIGRDYSARVHFDCTECGWMDDSI